MTRGGLATWCAALANTLVYAWVYRTYLHPVFFYSGGYDLLPRSNASFVATAVLSVLPLVFRARRLSAASALAGLIYALYYVPLAWGLHYGLHRDGDHVLGVLVVLAVCMSVLFLAAREWLHVRLRVPRIPSTALLIATSIMLVVICWAYRGVMRLVGFEDVYELRFEAADAGIPGWVGYVTMWCTYCFVPYCLARGLHCREAASLALGLAGSLLIYMATGAKSAILTPVILGGLYFAMRTRREFLSRLMLAMLALSLAMMWLLPEGTLANWARSVYFMRTMGSNGFTTVAYYEYFSRHGYTYYSHIGAIDALTDGYALYRPYSLGQLIGIEISGTEQSNFNAGFWASEGVAALGIAGLPLASLLVAAYLMAINLASRRVERRFAALVASGFGVALLNLPFATAMVSGGGLLVLLLLIFFKAPGRTAGIAPAPMQPLSSPGSA